MRSPLWGYVFFVGIAMLVMFVGVFRTYRNLAKRVVCGRNTEAISMAMMLYANDYDGKYPTPDQWCDLLIRETDISPKSFQCPLDPEGSFSYAINENVYAIDPNKILPQMVVLFEAEMGRNGVSGPKDLALRHNDRGQLGCNIAFADRHVEFVTEDRIGDLQWTAE